MDFVAGCVGGAAGCLASHPLDTVKVRLQCCQAATSLGTWQCFRQIVQNESFGALYKGLVSPLSTVAAINSVCFGSFGAILRRTEDPTALTSHFVAGAGAGLVICPLMCPMELAKCKLQMQSQHQSKNPQVSLTRPYILHQRLHNHHTFSGPVDCLKAVYRQEGYIGLNRGMLGLIVREVPAIGTYFACYEWFQKLYRDNMAVDQCPLSFLFLAGGSAGCLSWASSYPADVIKSRLQCDGKYDSRRKRFRYKYSGYYDCVCKSVKAEGFGVLFRGLSSSMLRAFPNNGVCLMVVSVCHSFYGTKMASSDSQSLYDTVL